jgi:hypothetical protein
LWWVLTSVPIFAAAFGSAFFIAASMSRVSGTSNSVSTSRDSPWSTTRPAFDQPQPPSGCSHA